MKLRHIIYLIICMVGLTAQADNILSLPRIAVDYNKTIQLPLALDNTTDVVAVQFTIEVPSGVTLDPSSAALTERADGHVVSVRRMATGRYMGMIYSSKNKPLRGRSGSIMTINLTANTTIHDGAEYPLTLSGVLISNSEGTDVSSAPVSGTLMISQAADFSLQGVTCEETSASPEDILHLSWQVSNVGATATMDGWREQIYLVDTDGQSKLLTTLYANDLLTPAQTISRQADVQLPKILGVHGAVQVRIVLVPGSQSGEPTWYAANNTASTPTTLTVSRLLYLTPAEANITEASAPMLRLQLTRSGSTRQTEEFTLLSDADTRFTLPTEVVIPAGQASTYFYAQVTPNHTLDDVNQVEIRLSGEGYDEVTSLLTIEDDTKPTLTLTPSAEEIGEGEQLHFVLAAERAPKADLPIILSTNLSKRFRLPQVVLSAGTSILEFDIEAIDDAIPDVEQSATITASAEGYAPGKYVIVLTDNDIPTLTLSLSPGAVSEGAGPQAVTATLRRTDNIDKTVTIKLSDDSNGNIFYGRQTIVMEKGVEEAIINLGPIENTHVDGERTYNITASVWIASCSCNANNGTSGGLVSVPLTVYDNDGPTLTMVSSASVLREGGEMTVTVRRNTDITVPLTVNITCDHDEDVNCPSTITIPTGQSAVSFIVSSNSNETNGDSFTAIITATAEGYATANIWFTVSDQTLPDAQITDVNVSSNTIVVGGTITADFTISNTGTYLLPELTKIGIYTRNSSKLMDVIYTQHELQPGESVVLTRDIQMPTSIGTYQLYAIVNDGSSVKELSTNNNTSKIINIRTTSPYSATIHSNKLVYTPGEKVILSGNISGPKLNSQGVEIYIINNNYRQTFNVTTEDDGTFYYEYEPYSGQMGHFSAGACYPGERLTESMAVFDIYGLKHVTSNAKTCEILLGDTYRGIYSISNPGNLPLTNLEVEVLSKPDNCEVSVSCPNNASANSTFDVEYTIKPTALSEGNTWQKIELMLTTEEGASLPITLYYYCRNKQGQLHTDVAVIRTTMIKGALRDYSFTITNIGKGETGNITIEIPSWMKLVTPRKMASLKSGESSTVILRLIPSDDMQINVPVTGTIGLNCTNGQGLSLPYSIEPVSESTGTLIIDVCDENTYYTEEKPHLAGATVVVNHPTTGALITSGTTGEDGLFSANLPEGYYAVSVSAPQHDSYRNNLLVDPGVENRITVNLSIQGITANWTVEETTVQDEYNIVTTVTYETNVPVPVVVLDMPERIEAKSLAEGESLIFYATLTNTGLITAEDVELLLPTGLRALEFEVLAYNTPFSLTAKQSVVIPIKVTHISSANTKGMHLTKPIDDDPCASQVGTLYYWDCGTDRKWHRYGRVLQLGSCNSNDPSTWDYNWDGIYGTSIDNNPAIYIPGLGSGGIPGLGGGEYYGSSTEHNQISVTKVEDCEPCQNQFVTKIAECLISLSPFSFLSCGTGLAHCASDLALGNYGWRNISGCIASAVGCFTPWPLSTIPGAIGCLISLTEPCDLEGNNTNNTGSGNTSSSGNNGNASGSGDNGNNQGSGDNGNNQGSGDNGNNQGSGDNGNNQGSGDNGNNQGSGDNGNNQGSGDNGNKYPDYINDFNNKVLKAINTLNKYKNVLLEFFGDEIWVKTDPKDICPLLKDIEDSPQDIINPEAHINKKPKGISKIVYYKFIERLNNTTHNNEEGTSYENAIDWEAMAEQLEQIRKEDEEAITLGYSSLYDMMMEAQNELIKKLEEKSSSVCASITLQFSQNMVMTRQAFRGTLTLYNGHETTAMTDIKLTLEVKDKAGNIAMSDKFQIDAETLTGLDGELALDGSWSLDAQKTGVVTILFTPTKYAAPTMDELYSFGGTLSYVDPFTGLTVTRDLKPVTLTVSPSPELNLTYFMQRDVRGDDPLTAEIEPSEEAEFSLLINNIGYGDAQNVQMLTDQPKIVDNEKGLLVDFELISSKLNGANKTLALGGTVATKFGTIPAKSTSFAQWWLKGSLLGHFTSYNIKATHMTSHGNPDLSLLNEVTIHELIRSLDFENGDTKLVGFMTNDETDAQDAPDHIYLSNGTDEDVHIAQATCTRLNDSQLRITMEPSTDGWNYAKVTDPFYGTMVITSIIRESDGVEMPLRNFWQTDRTLRDGKDPIAEDIIHMADCFDSTSSQSYILIMEKAELPESHLVLDEKDTDTPQINARYTHVSVARILKTDKWNTFVLPFNMTAEQIAENLGEDAEVKLLNGLQVNGSQFSMSFGTVNSIESGVPYMVRVHSDVNTIEVADRIQGIEVNTTTTPKMTVCDPNDLEENTLTFHGVFKRQQAPYGSHIINNNAFYLVNSTVNVSGYRGYITTQDNTGAMNTRAVDFFFDDTTTSLPVETTYDRDSVIYDLVGIRRRTLLPGVNIVNRKKLLK